MSEFFQRLWAAVRRHTALIWAAGAAVATLALALFSAVDIEPGQVGLRVNNLTGEQTPVTQVGWALRVPGVQSVYVLDAAPQTFAMTGDKDLDTLNVRGLTVRASDGSNFYFKDTTIIFQLRPDEADTVAANAGTDDGFLAWMKPYARAVLRDEFGRESTINVSDPTTYGEAATRAQDRLNDLLGPQGITVTQLVTPRPQFNDAYEGAIEERNALGNELQVIQSNLERAVTNRERTLADVDQKQNAVIQVRRASLESELASSVADQAKAKQESDTYRIATIGEGRAAMSAAKRRAQELEGELDARYKVREFQVTAFKAQPVERVMERLAEKLDTVTIDIQPYADDAAPARVRYEQVKP